MIYVSMYHTHHILYNQVYYIILDTIISNRRIEVGTKVFITKINNIFFFKYLFSLNIPTVYIIKIKKYIYSFKSLLVTYLLCLLIYKL